MFPLPNHDHQSCRADAAARASALCKERGARLTPLRQLVLEFVWDGHKPMGAYDILERLRGERGPVAPPTVYRALDFLLAHGLVHRIESLNAYVGCPHPDGDHGGQFLICSGCGTAAELNDAAINGAIQASAEDVGFTVGRRTIEVEGLCADCQKTTAAV